MNSSGPRLSNTTMPSPTRLLILVGTTYGNAEAVAQAVAFEAGDRFDEVEVRRMDGLDISVFDAGSATCHLICCATHGSGDVPDNAQALAASLANEPRYLGHVRYGVVALGDSSYASTYLGGGLRFDALLSDLGARRVGEVMALDAATVDEPDQAAVEAIRPWLDQALAPA